MSIPKALQKTPSKELPDLLRIVFFFFNPSFDEHSQSFPALPTCETFHRQGWDTWEHQNDGTCQEGLSQSECQSFSGRLKRKRFENNSTAHLARILSKMSQKSQSVKVNSSHFSTRSFNSLSSLKDHQNQKSALTRPSRFTCFDTAVTSMLIFALNVSLPLLNNLSP